MSPTLICVSGELLKAKSQVSASNGIRIHRSGEVIRVGEFGERHMAGQESRSPYGLSWSKILILTVVVCDRIGLS